MMVCSIIFFIISNGNLLTVKKQSLCLMHVYSLIYTRSSHSLLYSLLIEAKLRIEVPEDALNLIKVSLKLNNFSDLKT